MCIVFLYQNNSEDSHYKLILAANRDEYLRRPTKPAEFLQSIPEILCGIDEEGGNGGTWLGVNRSGKFAALTNVLVPHEQDPNKLSRGHIVMDYLKSGEASLDYMRSLVSKDFREYNFLAGSVDASGKVTTAFCSNCDGKQPRIITDDMITVACTSLDGNWRKMNHGQEIFQDLLTNIKNCPDSKLVSTTLIDSLLSDTTCLYPDSNVHIQAKDATTEFTLSKYCSIKIVDLPGYATRMQTVVLIDQDNKVHFVEKSLVGVTSHEEWLEKSFTFEIDVSK